MTKPVALIVLDGWGYREDLQDNAVATAKTPTVDELWKKYPHTLLEASGLSVGLPEGQMGNSEIGHTTIGAGKIIDTDLVRINKAIESGELAENPVLHKLFAHVQKHGSVLHVQGLVSPGGIHSHTEHLYALLRAAKAAGVTKLAIHAFTDGRDTAPRSAGKYLQELEAVLAEVGIGHIATVSGRFYAMDRDNNWQRLAKFEEALAGQAEQVHQGKASAKVEALYKDEKLDEHLEPMIFADDHGQTYPLQENDAVFIFNFRSDRARMLTQKLLESTQGKNIPIATLTEYNPAFDVEVAFPPIAIETTLATEISKAGLTQAHVAETEKFPHATYFLNGGRQEPHQGEEHVLLESRKDVNTHDQAPKMRAEAIADEAVKRVEQGVDFLFINFANPDMVGHTGNVPAIVEALEEVDTQLAKVVEAVRAKNGVLVITADHGNAEQNVDPATGQAHTSHTLNKVPCIVVGADVKLHEGTLADLAPTVLQFLELQQPAAMTGRSIIN